MTKTTQKTATTNVVEETVKQLNEGQADVQAKAQSFFGNLMEAGKLAFNSTIEIDKMILAHLSTTAKGALEHSRSVLAAKDVRTVIEMQTAFTTNSIEQGVANTKEVAELAQIKTKEVVSTFQKAA